MSTIKSWGLNTYTNSTWTDFIIGTVNNETVRGITISNVTGSPITLQVRVANSLGTSQAIVLPVRSMIANTAFLMDVDPLNLVNGQRLQIHATAAGLQFFASGISYTPAT